MRWRSLLVAAVLVVAATACGQSGGGTLVVLGDSLTAPVGTTERTDQDWLRWADPDGNYELVGNAGIPGQRTDEILARVPADVIDRRPEWCTVLAGTNDVAQGVDAMTIIANLTRIYDALEAAGIGIIAITIPPRVMLTPGQIEVQKAVNAWLRGHVEPDWDGAVLADWAPELSVGGDEVNPRPGILADGTHFSAEGARLAGQALRDDLATAP